MFALQYQPVNNLQESAKTAVKDSEEKSDGRLDKATIEKIENNIEEKIN